MAITRINYFEAKSGAEQMLNEFLQSVIIVVKECVGCLDVQLLRDTESPTSFVIIEQWDSIEFHQQAASAIPPEKLKDAFALFAAPPSGKYYS